VPKYHTQDQKGRMRSNTLQRLKTFPRIRQPQTTRIGEKEMGGRINGSATAEVRGWKGQNDYNTSIVVSTAS